MARRGWEIHTFSNKNDLCTVFYLQRACHGLMLIGSRQGGKWGHCQPAGSRGWVLGRQQRSESLRLQEGQ